MAQRFLLAALTLLFGTASIRADSFSVTLKVIDQGKKPVAEAQAAMRWHSRDGKMSHSEEGSATTDADGKAVMKVDDWNQKRPVLVFAADQMLGAVVGVSKENDGKEVEIQLVPTVHVKALLECKELGIKPQWANTMVVPDGFREYPAESQSHNAQFELLLPVGKYSLRTYGQDMDDTKFPLELSADQTEKDLGTLDIKATVIAKLKGKEPPAWTITDARGVKKEVQLSDYKGKWVFIEFWGFW
ncbi:MAG: hypothetical protein ACJ8C4_18895 [Gemmataceae bacterium]